jgi:hypothetical protein
LNVGTRDRAPTDLSSANRDRRWGWILIAGAVWTFWVWVTRIVNIAKLPQTPAFKAVHYTLAAGSLAFGAAAGWIGSRLVRRDR